MTYGNASTGRRTMVPLDWPGRRPCACGQPETHIGRAGGVAQVRGCAWCVRRWVWDPRRSIEREEAGP